MRRALLPSQNREAVVELRLYLPNLCLIALGGTQPCTACLGIALNYFTWPGFGISKLIKNYVANGRPRR